jgi:aminoglycoside phosphotransferase (APT) family kinase protein
MALTATEVLARLRDWLEAKVTGWSNVRLRPMEVSLGSGFSAEIFFVEVGFDTPEGPQSRTLVVRRQPTDFEVVLGSSLALQGNMMAALDRLKATPVPAWVGMELDPTVLEMPFLVMGRVEGHSATQRPNYNSEGWLADMTPPQRGTSWRNAIEAIAQMSKIDWQKDGFSFLANSDWGAPGLDQYLGHLEAWFQGCRKDRVMPYVDTAMAYMREHQPEGTPVNVLWGDSTPSNVMFSRRQCECTDRLGTGGAWAERTRFGVVAVFR